MSDIPVRDVQNGSKRLVVGVSLYVRGAGQSLWENGIFQNCLLLVLLLRQSPLVAEAVMVNGAGTEPADPQMMLDEWSVPLISMDEAMARCDVLIEMSALFNADWLSVFRKRGGKVITMRVGNDYVIDIERAMFDKPPGFLFSGAQYDGVWTIPEFEHSCRHYLQTGLRQKVTIVPHIWHPMLFDKARGALETGRAFGYRPGRSRWRIAMFEPNICMVKTSIIPMLVAEEAYRAQPSFVEFVRVCNTLHLKDHTTFVHFARSLDLVNHGLASFEGRFAIYEFMSQYGDAVVSHTWENAQNYLYYELLYGGYPLVHNSPYLGECGYYYPDFDCQEGGRQLLRAYREHDANLDAYRERTARLLHSVDIHNPDNVAAYTEALAAVYR
ncbi:DUF2827 domain-containing protein [Burkholderia glumae]|uniref:DUF2827 domain-containing protein n=4 Tax=Burkholderia glumae TaxID=337 RepID=A0AAQ0BSP6_BURGL|nr:DUF2827 domain-containing protein [Burkholderia glumae]ACR30654.1 Hypothetical protein bglu_2g01720 [Burkholderia glumae BGR1]AJY64673.1 hypothetical protein KS03_3475 [Burkholderia glumae LMG 2196 = ATCC 33617]MCM2509743.1 DUF2827 domain-containing protein [Burkholderia glumae]NVE25922.1 DUF2827 domain-containing protein [Burkholderia glumae]PNL05003.1 DUF2827 domain-containing protein [Burkholderia glumae]